MSAQIINGKEIAAAIRAEIKEKVAALNEQGTEVTLAVVLVGENPASQVYVRKKSAHARSAALSTGRFFFRRRQRKKSFFRRWMS